MGTAALQRKVNQELFGLSADQWLDQSSPPQVARHAPPRPSADGGSDN